MKLASHKDSVDESPKPVVSCIPFECELDKSAVAKHAWTYDHRIKWDEANILAMDRHRFSRKMRVNRNRKAQHDRSRG